MHLFVDGVATGPVATMGMITGSNYAMFDFSASPVSLSTGSHTIDLRADVVSGASYTVQTSLQQAADLVLYDPQVAVNIATLGPVGVAFVSNNAGTITINAGSASVVVDPTFQSMTNITGGATNVAVAKFKVHGYGEDVKVTTLSVTPVLTGCTPGCAGLNNLTVYFNGAQVGSSQTWTSGVATFNLGSQMILPAGTDSYIEVRADLQTNASVNYTAGSVSANLTVGSSNAQGQTSHTTLNFPTTTVVGTILTVQTGILAVSKNVGYANQIASPNTSGVKIGSFTLQNQSTSETVRITSLLVTIGGTTPLTNLSNLRTSETSGSGATPIQPAASNTFSVNFNLAPGATKTIDILADTSSATGVTIPNVDLTQALTTVLTTAAANGVAASSSSVFTFAAGGTMSTTVNGHLVTATAVTDTATSVTAMVNALNSDGTIAAGWVASSTGGTTVVLTRLTAGTAGNFTIVTSTTSGTYTTATSPTVNGTNNTAQVSTATPANVEVGDIFTVVINGTSISYTATAATAANVAAGLTAAINANVTVAPVVTAAVVGSTVQVTADVSGTVGAFTMTSSAANGSTSGGVTVIATLTITSIGATSNVSLLQNGNGTAVTGQTITLGAGVVTNPPTISSLSTSAQYVPAANGATNATQATFNFASTGGPSTITELTFTLGGTAGAVASVTVNGLTAPVVGTTAYITGLSIQVPNGGSGVNQNVFVTYAPVGTSGVASGSTSTLTLTTIKYQSGGTTATITGLSVSAPTMTLVGSKPTVTLLLPNGASGSSVSGLTVGTKYVADVKVMADAQGDIKVVTLPLVFTGNAAGTTTNITNGASGTTNLVIKNASGTVVSNYTVSGAGGGALQTSTALVTFTSGGYQIAAGTSETFKVEVNVSAIAGASSSLATGVTPGASFTWTDTAGAGAPGAGTGAAAVMPGYPTSSVSMTN
jgi:hypothetical protein